MASCRKPAAPVPPGGAGVPPVTQTDQSAKHGQDAHAAPGVGAGFMPAPAAGQQMTLDLGGGVEMKLAFIPAGEFQMGSDSGSNDEKPVHKVRISKPFYMGLTEVTQRQYEAVMGSNPSYFKGADNPVEQVSWNDAVEFCKKLSAKTGKAVRLPTEAEWEYASRAGSKTAYCFGDSDSGLGEYAWYGNNSDSKTHPVGQKKPNAWGLFDMHGNVWEWCSDWYDEGYYGKSASDDPTGASSGSSRVLRGGSWLNSANFTRSATRPWLYPSVTLNSYGFRVVFAQ